jgi:hypothetical protein
MNCLAGVTVTLSASGHATLGVRCRGCRLRPRCTTAKAGRSIHITDHDASSWPPARNRRAQSCAPPQASIPMSTGGSWAITGIRA